jgi:uncharacterized protein (TIGR02594 family)
MPNPEWLPVAVSYLGFHEVGTNRGIEQFTKLAHVGEPGNAWCAIFVNACLEKTGKRGTRSAMARSFENNANFIKLNGPAVGAVVTMWRESKSSGLGHVYFYLGENSKGIVGLGGNQSDQVSREYQPKARVTGYWWPKGVLLPQVGVITASVNDSIEKYASAAAAQPILGNDPRSGEFLKLKPEYVQLLNTVQLTDERAATAAAKRVLANKARYQAAEAATGVPWAFIGAIDFRESDCDPRASLGQGDPWNQVSTHEPRGKGPFKSWQDAAKYYLELDKVNDLPRSQWDMAYVCYKGEIYNGLGPRNRGIHTGYLWACTNHYSDGRYVADHQWDPDSVDRRPGIVAVMYQLVLLDESSYVGDLEIGTNPGPAPAPDPTPFVLRGTMWVQSMLNILMPASEDLLRVDGDYGRLTRRAVENYQRRKGLEVDGDAGPITTASMDRDLAAFQAGMEVPGEQKWT